MTATIPVQGGGEYVIHLGGEPMDWHDEGGDDREGYVQGCLESDGDPIHVTVAYDPTTGETTVSHVRNPYDEDREVVTELSMADEQPEEGSVWVGESGEIRVAIVPEGAA